MASQAEEELIEGVRPGLPSTQMLIAGLLAINLEQRGRDVEAGEERRPEVVLADLGMTLGQIATLTGRNYQTVKSTIRRARARTAAKGTRKAAEG